jgi:hypothetical protein
MSNHLAIATVTKALAQMLDAAVKAVVDSARAEAQRPDPNAKGARVNVFLYQVSPNAALRNGDLPTRNSIGQVTRRPTSALDLHYLLTFYGDEPALEPQRMLGAAVRGLVAEPGLSRDRIVSVTKDDNGDKLSGSNLADAFEQVKFTPVPLTLEELSRIWSIFYQTPYALSVAYLATVVLIESEEPTQPALPVLRRGQADQGVETMLGPFPILDTIHIGEGDDDFARLAQPSYPSARLGTVLTLRGRNLGGENLIVQFTHQSLHEQVPDIPVALTPGRQGEIKVAIPNPTADQTKWAAGIYGVTVVVRSGGQERSTNSLPVRFAPQIQNIVVGARDANDDVEVTIVSSPEVRMSQSAALALPDREVPGEARGQPADPLKFKVIHPAAGAVPVRLRVDGVDSMQFKRQGVPPTLVIDKQEVLFP